MNEINGIMNCFTVMVVVAIIVMAVDSVREWLYKRTGCTKEGRSI